MIRTITSLLRSQGRHGIASVPVMLVVAAIMMVIAIFTVGKGVVGITFPAAELGVDWFEAIGCLFKIS